MGRDGGATALYMDATPGPPGRNGALIEALFSLEPSGKRPPTRIANLADAEFQAIEAARARGCSWVQIHAVVSDRYKTPKSLSVAYGFWKKRQAER